MRLRLGIYCVVLLFGACQSNETSFESRKDLDAYLNDEDNGFIQKEDSKDFIVEAKLIPSFKNDKNQQLNIQMRISRKDGLSVLEIGGVSKQEISERELYLSFDILNDVLLENGKEDIKPIFSHYERNYGIKQSIDIYFTFPKILTKDKVEFVYRDRLFNQGLFKIPFEKELFRIIEVNEK